ncbi:MAG TPA: hypothetical protein VLA95_10490 [Gemmatimonadales bacterium]|nr:hypothetical protein [Gemmatimonadales bacterium]
MQPGHAPGVFVALLLALGSGTASAQAPDDACMDRRGTPIPSRTDNRMSYAGVATVEDGKPVIRWNRKLMDDAPEVAADVRAHRRAGVSPGSRLEPAVRSRRRGHTAGV